MNNLATPGMLMAVWLCLASYAGVILYFVIRGAKNTRSMADYATGNFQFSPLSIGLSLAAGMTSAATFIINPGFIAYYGLSAFLSMAVFLPLGALVSLVILSKKFRKIGLTIQAKTIAQWLGTRFQSNGFRIFIASLSLLHLTFIVLICVGLTQVLSIALNLNGLYVLIGIVVFTFGYMMFGGANSMVYTNTIQAVLKIVVAIIVLFSGFHFFSGDDGFFERLKAVDPQLIKPFNPASPLYRDFFEVVICQLIVGIAIVCQPHIITRSMLLKSDKDMNRFLTTAVLLLMLFFSVVFAGLYGRLVFPDLQFNGKKLPLDGVMSAYVISSFSPAMSLFLVVGLIASGIATLESLIQSISTTITSDIIQQLNGGKPLRNELTINKIVITCMALVVILVSYRQLVSPDLSVGILAQNGVYASFSAAFVPLLFGMFQKTVHKIVPIAASFVAILVHFGVYYGRLTPYMATGTRNPGVAAALAIISSFLTGVLLHWLTKGKNNAVKSLSVFAGCFAISSSAMAQDSCLPAYNFPVKFQALSSGKLAYIEKGEGQTILFIHGLGGNISHWQKQVKELSADYHCIAIDLPGYGWSAKQFSTGGKPRLQFYADLLEEFLEKKSMDPVTVAGHSMGAQIAVLLSLQCKRVKKLVLVAPAGLETFTEKEAAALVNSTPPSFFEKQEESLIRKGIQLNFYQSTPDADQLITARLRLKTCTDFPFYCQQVSEGIKAMLAEPVKNNLGHIRQPVLLLFGDQDALIPNRYLHPTMTTMQLAQQALAIIPDCKLQMIQNAGHLVQYEKSPESSAAIKNFMQ